MSITSNLSSDGKTLAIMIAGRFDFSCLQQFKNTYEGSTVDPTAYVVDLKESEYLDSSALGMLLALRDHAGGDDAQVKIINCNPDIKKILVITKLDSLFEVA